MRVRDVQRRPASAIALALGAAAAAACAGARSAERERPPPAPPRTISVEAGDRARERTPTAIEVPELAAGTYALRDPAGAAIPLQVDAHGRGVFVVPRLRAGERRELAIAGPHAAIAAADPAAAWPAARREEEGVVLSVGGADVAFFRTVARLPRPDIPPEYRRAGYLHPVLTPAGVRVTEDFPPNHLHHHGIWSSWAGAAFAGRAPDFWNMGQKKGRTDLDGPVRAWGGPVHAGVAANNTFVDLLVEPPALALREAMTVTVYRTHDGRPPYFLFDVELRQEAAAALPLELTEFRYGGLGLRGRHDWDGPDATTFLTSEGGGREANGGRARWCHMGGLANGAPVGIAVLSHPDNFRAPQPMRIHPSEPFFNFAPSQAGPFAIAPGRPFVARYRFVVADGPPDRALLDRLWDDFAAPPRATAR